MVTRPRPSLWVSLRRFAPEASKTVGEVEPLPDRPLTELLEPSSGLDFRLMNWSCEASYILCDMQTTQHEKKKKLPTWIFVSFLVGFALAALVSGLIVWKSELERPGGTPDFLDSLVLVMLISGIPSGFLTLVGTAIMKSFKRN